MTGTKNPDPTQPEREKARRSALKELYDTDNKIVDAVHQFQPGEDHNIADQTDDAYGTPDEPPHQDGTLSSGIDLAALADESAYATQENVPGDPDDVDVVPAVDESMLNSIRKSGRKHRREDARERGENAPDTAGIGTESDERHEASAAPPAGCDEDRLVKAAATREHAALRALPLPPLLDKFSFTDDFQDLLLACMLRHPQQFASLSDAIHPKLFNGTAAFDACWDIKEYEKKYGNYPSFVTLGNLLYRRFSTREPDRAKEAVDYVRKLARIETAQLEGVVDLVIRFSRERAFQSAVRVAMDASYNGRMDPEYVGTKDAPPFREGDFYEIFDKAFSIGSGMPKIESAATLVSLDLPEPAELVQGLLHQGSKMVIGGPSKARKTFTLLDLALSIAYGKPFWGLETAQGRVLYVNLEVQREFFRRRLHAVATAKGVNLEPGPLDQLDVWNMRGHAADYKVMIPKIEQAARSRGYSLIILDPQYKLLGNGDENSARDMSALMNGIESLAVKTGGAVAFGSHFAKGNASSKESIDRISGSGVFARDPDSIVTLTPHLQPDAYAVEATLRNFAPLESFVVRWKYPLMIRDGDLDPSELKQGGGRKVEYDANEILSVLATEPLKIADWQKRCADENGMSKSTFYRVLKRVKKSGTVAACNGKWRVVPEVPES